MENAHSILAPSSGHIWGAENGCTAHVKMAQQYLEPEDSAPAAEGTASHEVGERLIRGGLGFGDTELTVGSVATNGVIITDEMIENAEIYSDNVLETYRNSKNKDKIQIAVEHKGPITRIHPECFGTKDCWMWDPATSTLYIWDYKYGHRFVEVFEWIQGILYAAGLLDQLNLPLDCNVVFRIVQPRAYSSEGPIREWSVKMAQLLPHFDRLRAKAETALGDGTLMNTGTHCRDCYPRFACFPALQAGMGLYEVASVPVTHKLSKGALGLQLTIIDRAVEQLKSLKVAFEGQVEATMKGGEAVPGWGLQATSSREVWQKPITEVVAMGKMVNVPVEKPGAMTPNQARKAGVPEDILSLYAGRNGTGHKLVKDNGLKARKAFSYNESNQ